MGRKPGPPPDILAVSRMLYKPFYLDRRGLVHFIAQNRAHKLSFHTPSIFHINPSLMIYLMFNSFSRRIVFNRAISRLTCLSLLVFSN